MEEVDQTNKGDFSVRMLDGPIISIMESLQKEKQIVVDPLSLKESLIKQGFFDTTMIPNVKTTSAATILHPPPLQPPKQKFLSLSLPNSANSSPRFASPLSRKKSESESPESQCQASNLTLKEQHLLQEVHLRKSKSCGERKACAPSNEFDHWLTILNALEHDNRYHGRFTKTEAVKESPKSVKHKGTPDDSIFRCSALCLYLPGFGNKVKPDKTRKEESQRKAVMSRTVSLENFECGSWASSAILSDIEGEFTNSYFDLPLELIKCSNTNEVYSPIAASFVFEKDLKGILKNGSSRANARKSVASPRHVQFSTSSSASCPSSPASCITPRLRKARADFNAFLAAAQSA